MEYLIRREELESRPLAVVRRLAEPQELSKVVPEACGVVWGMIRSEKIEGAGRNVAVYYDGEINLEVGVELDTPFTACGEVVRSRTPSGPTATTTHFGSYGQLNQAHEAIREWASREGYQFAGPNWEIYGHWTDQCNTDASKIRTDVFYLLRNDANIKSAETSIAED